MQQAVSDNITVLDQRPRSKPGDASGYHVTTNEALFLRCILQCQNDYGIKPPVELGLPRSIGLVVDYDYVKRLMFTKMLRGEDNTPDGLQRHCETVKAALKTARLHLMEVGVIGSYDPVVWWTGKPVEGVQETRGDTVANAKRARRHPDTVLRVIGAGRRADGKWVTQCAIIQPLPDIQRFRIAVAGRSSLEARP